MSEVERCPQCGGRLSAGSAEGLCPRCLLTLALRQPAETAPENLPEPGCQIGSCRIVRLLGEGGMGLVYLAEQEEPIARQVALKIIKLGMDTRAVLGRFQSEQQALALMEHPNIAQVYEAGSNAQGRPYFVMEYVPGIPITDYCDRHRLGTRQRLELFLQVVNAVQHAHQKGVIHRDLKPSNVLVMERDGEAVPKIIDFGLAKATEKHLTEETAFTEAGVLIGTPEYMSPEQASLGRVSVDTRTDVYSLGVLLYELLVGAAPFESKLLRSAGYDEIRRIIREDDPPTPAARLEALGPEASEIASRRATEAGALRKQVRGELDWITMKALEKDCARRYPSASEMAVDIQHYLHDEPVTAGLAGRAYRLRKFVRKHQAAVTAAAVIFLLLTSGLGISSGLLIKIQRLYTLLQAGSYAANVAAAELMLRDNQTGAARRLLLACEPTLRKWEWRHLWQRLNSSPASFSWGVEGLVFEYEQALQIGFAGSRICWNTTTTVRCSEGPGYASPAVFRFYRVLGLSNDGALAVTAGDEGISVVEVASGKSVSTCRDCKNGMGGGSVRGEWYPFPAIFSPDKSQVAMSGGPGTVVWDVRSGKKVGIAAGHALAFSPDGTQIALTLGKDVLDLWNVDPPHRIASLAARGQVNDAAFSPGGARLASVTSKGEVLVWELRPLSGPTALAAVGQSLEAIAFSPDGRSIAATGSDGAVRIWHDGKLAASLPLGVPEAQSVAFSADGTRLAAGNPLGVLYVWDATTYGGPNLRPAADLDAIAVSPDSTSLAAGFRNGRVELWGMDGAVVRCWPAHRESVSSAAFSPDSKRLITGSFDKTARLWDVASGTPSIELRGHTEAVTAVAFSPDGARVATGSGDGTARVWDAASGRAIATIKLKDSVESVVFSPDGAAVLVGAGGGEQHAPSVGLWNAATGTVLRELWSESCRAPSPCLSPHASFSRDGRRVVAYLSTTNESRVWDARTGAVAARLRADGIGPRSVVFDPDGDRIVMGGSFNGPGSDQGAVQIWDAVRYEPLLTLRVDEGIRNLVITPDGPLRLGLRNLVFTPDGSRLLGLTYAGVRTWDTRTAYPPPERGGAPLK